MNEDLEQKVHVIIGLFVLSCLGGSLFYDGRDMLVICLVGLAMIGALLNAIDDARGGRSYPTTTLHQEGATMPMTLNIGLSRKVGEANYGSRGASVNFAVELEASLLREPEQLRAKIKYLFAEAKLAVDEELNDARQETGGSNGHHDTGNGKHAGNGNGHHSHRGRGATSAQVRAIHAIAGRERIDLPNRLNEDFGLKRPEDLSISQASELIDAMKSAGTGGRR